MAPPRKYPDELRQRAVRLVMDAQKNPNDRRGAFTRIGAQLGIPADTIRGWVRTEEIDQGVRPGTSTDDATRLAELQREAVALRRANEILRSASAFFAAEAHPESKRAVSDAVTTEKIIQVHIENYSVYGARKVYAALNRAGHRVARCTHDRARALI